MSKFSDEYVELCRKLALPREWQEGDWFVWRFGWPENAKAFYLLPRGWSREQYRQLFDPPYPPHRSDPSGGPVGVWLPREGDWLDLLEAEGSIGVRIARLNDGYGAYETGADPSARFIGEASDRLIAFCRLWCAVTGREVDG